MPVLRGLKLNVNLRPAERGVLPVAAALRFDVGILGPVTSVVPLRVLGQELTVTADTVLLNVTSLSALQLGQIVVVSGHVDVNGSMLATSVVRLFDNPSVWLLTGYATAINANGLMIGPQQIALGAIVPDQCGAGIAVGNFIDLRANAIANFTPTTTLNTLTRLSCASAVAFGTPGAAGVLEGLVDSLNSASSFQMGGLRVTHSAATVFQFGDVDDLEAGVRIEMEGSFVTASEFAADAIAFVRPIARFRAPVSPADVAPNDRIRILGRMVRRSAQLRDQDLIQTNGLSLPRQVEVRGFVDRNDQIFSTRVRDRGTANFNAVTLRGDVDSTQPPILTVLGLTVDSTGGSFIGFDGTPVSSAVFFAQATVGATINVDGAAYTSATGTLRGGILSVIAPDLPALAATPLRILGVTQSATFGAFQYADGFE